MSLAKLHTSQTLAKVKPTSAAHHSHFSGEFNGSALGISSLHSDNRRSCFRLRRAASSAFAGQFPHRVETSKYWMTSHGNAHTRLCIHVCIRLKCVAKNLKRRRCKTRFEQETDTQMVGNKWPSLFAQTLCDLQLAGIKESTDFGKSVPGSALLWDKWLVGVSHEFRLVVLSLRHYSVCLFRCVLDIQKVECDLKIRKGKLPRQRAILNSAYIEIHAFEAS